MRNQKSVFTACFFLLLIVLSCGVTPSDARRCTRICEKGRCRPICLRDASMLYALREFLEKGSDHPYAQHRDLDWILQQKIFT